MALPKCACVPLILGMRVHTGKWFLWLKASGSNLTENGLSIY